MASTRGLPAPPFLYPILDAAALGGRPCAGVLEQLAAAGVRLVQVRGKGLSDRALVELARGAVEAGRALGVAVLVNDRPDVARLVGADGVHVGQGDLAPRQVRTVLPPDTLVGYSTHDLDQLRRAAEQPVDYVAFGPVFPTRSKQGADPVVGLEGLARARRLTSACLVAIGGVTLGNVAEAVRAGADGLAVIADLLAAEDVGARARDFMAVLAEAGRARRGSPPAAGRLALRGRRP